MSAVARVDQAGEHLVLSGVQVSLSGFMAVAGLDLKVERGELRCLIGPNGAGKTTALDLICGKVKPTAGEIRFNGISLNRLKEYRIARTGIGRKFQVPSVFKDLTVLDNLQIAHSRHTGVFRNLAVFGNRGELEGLHKLAELVGLEDELQTPAAYLSHGQTQWLEIALLLAQDPQLILMDEPTAGMSTQETDKTANLFDRLKGHHTLIVVEHDMGFVREVGSVISVMHQGKLLAEGTIAQIETDPLVREAYLGKKGIADA